MRIKFWGVRGSIPSPGASTVRYGGNTSCVSVEVDKKTLVLDAGSGIKKLGDELRKNSSDIFVLISHKHWDHIQGFPFFAPLYQKDRRIYVIQTPHEKRRLCGLIYQMDGAHFPVKADDLPSKNYCIEENIAEFLAEHGFHVTTIEANHPGGGHGYRIEDGTHSMIYLTDNELNPPYEKVTEFDEFVRFCHGTEVLIHDAQYIEEDMPQKHGWGHSVVNQVIDLALAAEVKQLLLYHHDPDRTDLELEAIEKDAQQRIANISQSLQCAVAYEGLEIEM
ncbi:MBL fold metallo-hydrolase [Candidatus Neomarinimicrobiota bacterium]